MTDKIRSDEEIPSGGITVVETKGDVIKIKAACAIAGAALFIGSLALIFGIIQDKESLVSWATGLISLVVGAAIGFVFSSNGTTTR